MAKPLSYHKIFLQEVYCHILIHEDHDMMRPLQVLTVEEAAAANQVVPNNLVGSDNHTHTSHSNSSLLPDISDQPFSLGTQTDLISNTNNSFDPLLQPSFAVNTDPMTTGFSLI
jgi:hypothetical protein